MPSQPRMYFAPKMPTGLNWPAAMGHALRHSKLLVAVWTPPYFRSPWCLAEWRTVLQREQFLGMQPGLQPGLIYPIVYSDGEHFHEDAKNTQGRKDLAPYTCPTVGFVDTELYVEFFSRMQIIAQELALQLAHVPDWQEGWPLVQPSEPAEANPPMKLPTL